MIKGITPRAEYELVGGTKATNNPAVKALKQQPQIVKKKKVNVIPKAEYSFEINE